MKSFKVFGERHTGTNAISSFLEINFNLENKYYEYLGWKHRLAPSHEELKKFNLVDNLFLITFRNPYSWLKAMHKEPYNYNYPQIRELDFLSFLQIPFEDYENVIKMWNQKNQSYLNMKSHLPNSIYIKIESFREEGEVGIHKTVFKSPDDEIILYHNAYNRKIFAQGALDTSQWISYQSSGFYTYENYLEDIS